MSAGELKSMRDVFLERIHAAMGRRDDIFLVSDHFGSRVLEAELDRLSTLVRHGRRRLHIVPSGGWS